MLFTVKYIHKRKQTIIEGELRCEQLSEYLEKLNVPKKVWISEDATGIVARISYDNSTNQLIGLLLPTNEKTGMQMPFTFIPQTAQDINDQIKNNPMSTLVYIILAQPMCRKVPPFILAVFGTDNRFKTLDVLLRWRHMQDQLKRYVRLWKGIELLQTVLEFV